MLVQTRRVISRPLPARLCCPASVGTGASSMFLWPPTTTTRLRRFPGAYLVAKVRLLKKWRCIAVSIRPTRKSHQVNSIRKVKTTTTQYHKQAVRRITTSSAYLTSLCYAHVARPWTSMQLVQNKVLPITKTGQTFATQLKLVVSCV